MLDTGHSCFLSVKVEVLVLHPRKARWEIKAWGMICSNPKVSASNWLLSLLGQFHSSRALPHPRLWVPGSSCRLLLESLIKACSHEGLGAPSPRAT